MTMETAGKAMEYILAREEKKNEKVNIFFHGGEPFLNFPVIYYLVTELKKRLGQRAAFAAATNGTVLSGSELEFAGTQIEGLSVSLDGDQKTHDAKRKDAWGNGSHKKALAAAKKLLTYNPNLRVRMTFDHKSVYRLAENVAFLAAEGFPCIVANADFYDQNWSDEDIEALKEQIKDVKGRFEKENILISLLEPVHLYCKGDCSGGITGLHIFPNGTLYPCILAGGNPDFAVGTIETGIDLEKLDRILAHGKQRHPECGSCALASGCDGARCMIMNRVVMGAWLSPIPIVCQMRRVLYEMNGVR